MNRRIAFYGGTFDPVHLGHMDVAKAVVRLFELDEFIFIPAFHAPHKSGSKPTSAFHRFAMLCEASDSVNGTSVSTIEVELPEKPYTIETIGRLKKIYPKERLFMVIGADSWQEITTWRDWEGVLTEVDVIVVTRPGYKIGFDHVTQNIKERIVDLRNKNESGANISERSIFITDTAYTDISASAIRRAIREGDGRWRNLVDEQVRLHVDKYRLYVS